MEPVPMSPLPTAAPSNQVGPAPAGAGPSAEGLADGPIAHDPGSRPPFVYAGSPGRGPGFYKEEKLFRVHLSLIYISEFMA